MNKIIFDKLKNNRKSSFALWDQKDSNNPKDASGMNWIDGEYNNNFKNIKENIIFVGMNMAEVSENDVTPFDNFHSKNIRHNDYRLRNAISNTRCSGAYMTDLFSFPTGNSKELKKHYKNNPTLLKKDIETFIEECRFVCEGMKYIICIGTDYHYQQLKKYVKNHSNTLKDFVFFDENNNMMYIPHHSPMNTHIKSDKDYVEKVVDSINKYNIQS